MWNLFRYCVFEDNIAQQCRARVLWVFGEPHLWGYHPVCTKRRHRCLSKVNLKSNFVSFGTSCNHFLKGAFDPCARAIDCGSIIGNHISHFGQLCQVRGLRAKTNITRSIYYYCRVLFQFGCHQRCQIPNCSRKEQHQTLRIWFETGPRAWWRIVCL